ncbi:hypothetical protein ACED96_00395 [Clostridium thermobutyricum]|uniref:Uncharacterized protein n=1 Tax=Clostridium thermobutyricum DSM 4928 TaxID=1121339 RepID=A0A1V4SRM6_9CLOT|nr:hypothetical protein [Clostridium thermobutyricum]OPX46504.1 hypothetical protein CLTHE_27250 [Clostridium thermobutyricum DSM 4928]
MYYEEKTYKSFILILVLTFIVAIGAIFIIRNLEIEEYIAIKIMFLIITNSLLIISNIIYKKERLYWINKYTYENVKSMSKEERKQIAKKFYNKFKFFCLILVIYCIIGLFIKTHIFLDVLVYITCLVIGAAISTYN